MQRFEEADFVNNKVALGARAHVCQRLTFL